MYTTLYTKKLSTLTHATHQPESGLLARTFRRLFARTAHISAIQTVSPHFRTIEFAGDSLKNVKWSAGQQIRFVLSGAFTKRTYTPTSWDPGAGRLSMLIFLHGVGPGCQWVKTAKVNDKCDFVGPSRSLEVPVGEKPVVLFGDETCFGVAMALKNAAKPTTLHCVFEVTDLAESKSALERFGISETILVERSADHKHLEQVNTELTRLAGETTFIGLSGNARSIQPIKKHLAASGVSASRIRVKPYWSPGKKGLE